MKCFGKYRPRPLQHPAEADERGGDGAHHHEHKARIPTSGADGGEVEKVKDLGRIGHAGNHKPEAEDQADGELDEDRHGRPQSKCLMMKVVAIPVAMKTSVATMERTDSREMPQTPCPEVQPLPHTEPKPTRRPARTSRIPPVSIDWAGKFPVASRKNDGTATSPARNAMGPASSRSPEGGSTRAAMPLMPAIRPLNAISITAERPINAPPAIAAVGGY